MKKVYWKKSICIIKGKTKTKQMNSLQIMESPKKAIEEIEEEEKGKGKNCGRII